MKQFTIFCSTMIFCIFLGACNTDLPNDTAPPSVAEFEQLNTAFNNAVAKKDIDGILALYSDKMLWLPPNEVRKNGLEPVKNNYLRITTNQATELSHRLDTVFMASSGDLAVMIGTYYFKLNSEIVVTDTGKFALTVVKEENGWKIRSDVFNSDLPLTK